MDTVLQNLLSEVEAYLAKSGMAPTTFGKLTLKDGAVVWRMREGKPMTSKNMSLIQAFMAGNPPQEKDVAKSA